MNLNCIICAELFSPSDDIFVTACGHMFHHHCLIQWLERAKTCPQCRHKCHEKDIHKIYFNICNDSSRIDVGSLQQQLEFTELTVKSTEKELASAKKTNEELNKTMIKAMKTIANLENKLKHESGIISTLNQKVAIFQEDRKHMEDLRNEVKRLKNKIDLMNSVEALLTSTETDVDKMLKDVTDTQTLSVWVATLKRELRACEGQKINIRNALKVTQHDLRKEREKRDTLENKLMELESENYILKDQIHSLQKETPVHKDAVPCSSDCLSPINAVPNKKICFSNYAKISSLSIPVKVKQIQESNSPYLNIKQSSIGLAPFLKFGRKYPTPEETSSKVCLPNIKVKPKFLGVEPITHQKSKSPRKSDAVELMRIEVLQRKEEMPNLFPPVRKLDKKETISDRLKSGKLKRHASDNYDVN